MRTLRRALITVALAATSMIGSAAGAQAPAPVAARYSDLAGSALLRQPAVISGDDPAYDGTSRIALGIVGAFGGAFAGGGIGRVLDSGCHGEFCELGGVIVGAAIGLVAAATFLSAALRLGSKCTTTGRELRALGGSITGALTGGVVGLIGGPLSILTHIVGSGIGAGVGAAIC
jgi:hypothetical protein